MVSAFVFALLKITVFCSELLNGLVNYTVQLPILSPFFFNYFLTVCTSFSSASFWLDSPVLFSCLLILCVQLCVYVELLLP